MTSHIGTTVFDVICLATGDTKDAFRLLGVVPEGEVIQIRYIPHRWHNCVLEVTRKGPRKQGGAWKRNVSNVTVCRAVKTAEQKEHRLSKPRTKEKARRAARAAAEVVSRDYCSLIPRPHPSIPVQKSAWRGLRMIWERGELLRHRRSDGCECPRRAHPSPTRVT